MAPPRKKHMQVDATAVVKALIDRLIATEKQLSALRKELDSHFEMIAELQPKIMPTGHVKLRAMEEESETCDEFDVLLLPESIVVNQTHTQDGQSSDG